MAAAPPGVKAVVIDLDDTLIPWQTVAHWQWAWRPRGPVLSERRTMAAIHRSLHDWDRRRWHGLIGTEPQPDGEDHRDFLAETLAGIAGHALPEAETDAVVERFLKPAGEIERYPDTEAALGRLGSLGLALAVSSALPEAAARHALHRVGLGKLPVVATAERPVPGLPVAAGYRTIAKELHLRPSEVLYVGDLFWSDVRAAARAGMPSALMDHRDWAARVQAPRLRSLSEIAERVLHPVDDVPEPPNDGPTPPPDENPPSA
ncbi:MAG: HAD family hydrolase [Thermoplasmata archaeon]|nr:HAD family hydrolase [Thermoplasmata archaeon]